jgi:hypothetical protein
VEVWFDSGSTHSYVLDKRPELTWPANLYLEGSDQHRGWFHSSLLKSCGTKGTAPFQKHFVPWICCGWQRTKNVEIPRVMWLCQKKLLKILELIYLDCGLWLLIILKI